MKNVKNLLILVIFSSTLCIIGCKPVAEVKPASITEKLIGNYTMSELNIKGQTLKLPLKQGSDELYGTIQIKKNDDTQIEVLYNFVTIVNGVKESDDGTDKFYVKQGAKDIELFEDDKFAKQIGSLVGGKTLYLVSGETDRITAIKN